jgi:hypothetical protein
MRTNISFPLKGCGVPGSKKARKRKNGSSTSGRQKTTSCRATWQQRDWAKRSRSYKDTDYPTITSQMNRKARGEMVKA